MNEDGVPQVVQTRPLVRWPDGSVKWMLLDWYGEGGQVTAQVIASEDVATPLSLKSPVTVEHRGETVVVRTPNREFQFQVGGTLGDAFDLQIDTVAEGGLLPTIEDIEIVDRGPVRVGIRLRGRFARTTDRFPLQWAAEGDFFANESLQRWSLALRNTRAAKHPGGIWELGDAGSVMLRGVAVTIVPGESCDRASLSLEGGSDNRSCQRFELHQMSSGGTRWNSSNHVDERGALPFDACGYQLTIDQDASRGDRAIPSATLYAGQRPILGIHPEHFWQHFPQRLRGTTAELGFDLFPMAENVAYELQGGEQTTRVFWIAEGESATDRTWDRLRARPIPRFQPEELTTSRSLDFVVPISEKCEDSRYRALVDQAVEGPNSFFAKRERIDEYGWRHFGDAYGDHEAAFANPEPPLISHWNNQYDLVFGLGVRYLRGGDDRWFELMEDMAWHVADIDMYHTDDDKAAYNHGLFWHTVHYIDAGKATHRSYPKGSCGGGPCAEHSYARGLLLYYCLTGESAIRDAVVEMGEWILNLEDGSRTPFRLLSSAPTGLSSASGNPNYHGPGRGPGNASETLLTAFELTGRREFLARVEELMYRVVHPREDLQRLNLLDAERRWYYTLYLQALGRYLQVKIDLDELDDAYHYGRETLLHYARWMAEHEYPYLSKPEILEYPTETWAAQDMRKSEVFRFASLHARGEEHLTFVERAEFFYESSVSTLSRMETRHFCRPVALLLGSGFSRDGFRANAPLAPAPRTSATQFPKRTQFVPQKQQALARAKALVVASLAVALVGLGTCVAFLLMQ